MARITRFLWLSLCACLFLPVSPVFSAPPASRDARGVELVRVPDDGIQPQAAVESTGTLHLIYYKGAAGGGDVFYVHRGSQDGSWSTPLRVNSQPESAVAAGTIRGAQLALGKGNRVHVAWNGSKDAEPRGTGKYSSPMLYARLNDASDAFEPQRNVMHEGTALDGGGSVAADGSGRVYVVWHAAPSDGAGEANRRVYVATSTDEGRNFLKEAPADAPGDGVCGCCGLKAFADSQGTLRVLYRSAKEMKNRDMHLLTSSDRAATFQNALVSPWPALKCPMSSESFTEGPLGVYAAWETDGQVSWALLDAGNERAVRTVSPAGTPSGRKHPSLAVNKDGRVLFVWTEGTGWQKGGSLAWQEFDKNGKATSVRGRQPGIAVWSFAAAVALPDGRFAVIY
jgi:hypothetical protein